jgi:hypothetical protein
MQEFFDSAPMLEATRPRRSIVEESARGLFF